MSKVAVRTHDGVEHVWYYCPGCRHLHGVPAERWHWNRDTERPTLSPSVRHYFAASEHGPEKTVCHYFVREGRIEFCLDSVHALSGQTVDLIEPTGVPDNS